ncbi:hypothetical protein KR767_04160 [Luteibacter anthropi]|uniref:hypothetical protein n=1 Tax=Luteibacter anthropi TaxID=564369 RepID=UPI0020322A45|nr:hypothetical protein [Luteibacter anthropi]URX63271.1 hypothetical protein KR767_04160 [Luteibacter anthropi]
MNIQTNGDNNRVAGRDYNEYTEAREDEPEWSSPPYASGLILCPGCRRRHINRAAVACPRCGYPQREISMEEHRRSLLRINREQAKLHCYAMLGFVSGILIGLLGLNLLGLSLLGFALTWAFAGYALGPVIEEQIRNLFDRR